MRLKQAAPRSTAHNSWTSIFALALLVVFAAMVLPGCNVLKQVTGEVVKPGGTKPSGGPATAHNNAPSGKKPGMDGYWKLAFSLNDAVQSSHIKLTQTGDKFSGEGTDDDTNKPFFIENGLLKNGEVVFYKRYEHPDNPNSPPVEYSGALDTTGGSPYMSGKFLITTGQQEVSGDWEAQREPAEGEAAPKEQEAQQQQPQQPATLPPNQPPPGKPPDISGKWTVGFEYQFKIVHSTMFLEQVKDKFTGHGFDDNTNERFEIEKGWYSYPKLTLVRKYPAIKTKKVTKPERRMTFKADVSWVSDKDYSGPYMSGKTEGGGNWEAQRVY